jgi:hypothetical protein
MGTTFGFAHWGPPIPTFICCAIVALCYVLLFVLFLLSSHLPSSVLSALSLSRTSNFIYILCRESINQFNPLVGYSYNERRFFCLSVLVGLVYREMALKSEIMKQYVVVKTKTVIIIAE